jgi:Holliday junction resolvase RusA-like endonuclease
MDDKLVLDLPLPPSTNAVYRTARNIASVYLSKAGKDYKKAVREICELHQLKPYEGSVRVDVWVYFKRRGSDLANREKLMLDALEGYAYVNDRDVVELHMYKRLDKDYPHCEVHVTPVSYRD